MLVCVCAWKDRQVIPSDKQPMPRGTENSGSSTVECSQGCDGVPKCAMLLGEVKLPLTEAKPCANQHMGFFGALVFFRHVFI
jgi:hypothetical protein